jgi:alkanesulfonate monooxygenase SsuD/methylene tetrahydromethanopterin reductase-like flavin-dependent oxidoreductase (luciferase family)
MIRPLLVGVQLPEVERRVAWSELLDMARAAEDLGVDSLWVGDHLLYDLPDGTVRGPWEVWTSLAALAAVTTTVRLGPLVASLGFHDPAMLAKMAATVDGVSDGRLVLGVGAGWNEREYRAFGLPFGRRVDRFEESFHVVRRLLAGEEVTAVGEFHSYERCRIDPPAVQLGGPPVLVGSIAPRMLSITAPHAAMWNVWFAQYGNTAEGFAEVAALADARCVAAGRAAGEVQGTAAVYMQAPSGGGRVLGGDGGVVAPLTGEPQAIADELRAFAAAGAREVQLVLDPITLDSIRWVGQVLARLDR